MDFQYHVDLSKFDKQIKGLNLNLARYDQALNEAFDEIGDMVLIRLNENILANGLGDTKLAGTASIEKFSDGFSVSVTSEYAMYIEYGTGITGANNPHPKAVLGYDLGGHGEEGWYYPTTASDPNPWKHYYNGKLYGFTRGLPSRPFMYETWLYGTRIISNVVSKHIRRALKQ